MFEQEEARLRYALLVGDERRIEHLAEWDQISKDRAIAAFASRGAGTARAASTP